MTSDLEIVCEHLGVSRKTMSEAVPPLMSLLVNDSFGKRSVKDYRDVAIDRAIASKCNFSTEWNTIHEFAKRYVKAVCPHCGRDMKVAGGSGSNSQKTVNYTCDGCGTTMSLSMPPEGISVRPVKNMMEVLIPRK